MQPESFPERVLAVITRLGMLPDREGIGVAVSGGADSVALLRALHSLASERRWRLVVLHVNHKLRAQESDGDAQFVQQLATDLGLMCETAGLPISDAGNLEQEARTARNVWFCEMMRRRGLARVALGHTQSDQAETVLFRFLRGAGTAGLAAIRPATREGFVRPLLYLTRAEAREYLRALGQTWREDSSNQSLAFDRNRIRLELLPALERNWNPNIQQTLAATAEWARAEEDYWESIVAALAAANLTPKQGAQLCPANALNNLPRAAARRLVRHAIGLVRGDLQSVEFAHVEKILFLASQTEGSGRLQVPGVDVMRSFDWLRFAVPGTYPRERYWSSPVRIPGEIPLPGQLSTLVLQLRDGNCSYNKVVDCLDGDGLPDSLELRTWQPGDRYQPVSHPGVVKLKTLFQEARIPLWDRNSWPVLAAGETIVWTRGFGVGAGFAASSSTRRAVVISEVSAGS